MDFLTSNLDETKVAPSPALGVLAKLPFRLVITTNYDNLLERALDLAARDYRILVQPAGGLDDTPETRNALTALEQYEGTIVYKIHGTFDHEAASRARYGVDVAPEVTITEDDYIDFLTTHDSESGKPGSEARQDARHTEHAPLPRLLAPRLGLSDDLPRARRPAE